MPIEIRELHIKARVEPKAAEAACDDTIPILHPFQPQDGPMPVPMPAAGDGDLPSLHCAADTAHWL